jgi:hypothetical protein
MSIVFTASDVWTGNLRHMTEQPHYIGWRCLHAREGGMINPIGMPNVRRALNAPPVEFTPELQQLAYEVMTIKNPSISRNEFENVFDSDTAFTNRHGVESNDPKLMDGIICAGMFLPDTVGRSGEYLVAFPGVHAIDATKPLPTAAEVIERGWYFVANTGTGLSGAFNLPQGDGGPVCVIYALAAPARYPVSWFGRWNGNFLPDPLRYGG